MFHRSDLFAIPSFSTMLPGAEDHIPALLEHTKKLRQDHVGIVASNQGAAWHSDRDFHIANLPAVTWYRESICAFATEALLTITPKAFGPWRVEMIASWAIAADKGGFLMPHNHFPVPWAGVFYLDAEDGIEEGSLQGRLDFLCPIPVPEIFGLHPSATATPKNGCALLFPGALQHAVHPHRSEKTRYSVSFNLALKRV